MSLFLQYRMKFAGLFIIFCLFPIGVFSAETPAPLPGKSAQEIDPKTIVTLVNPLGGHDVEGQKTGNLDLRLIVGGVLKKALGILGSLALLVFVYGGFLWITAAGNVEHVSKGAQAMEWAVIGICIIFSSYAIIDLIFQGIGATVSKQGSYEQKTGQVWCRDKTINLCLAMKSTECAGETFNTLDECEGNNTAYEGGWCFNPDKVYDKNNMHLACVPTIKVDCDAKYFNQTFEECEEDFESASSNL